MFYLMKTLTYHIDESCLAGVLQADERELHLLLEEERLEPVKKPLEYRKHHLLKEIPR